MPQFASELLSPVTETAGVAPIVIRAYHRFSLVRRIY